MPQAREIGNTKETIPIRPILGMWSVDPGKDAPLGASPDMLNLRVSQGALVKRPGYTQLESGSGLGEPVTGLYATQDALGVVALVATGTTKVWKFFSGDWVEVTGAGLTGTSTDLFSFETSQNKIVFSQGIDPIQVMDIGGATYAGLSADAPAAKFLCRFDQRLVLGSTFESATPEPFRTRWPVANDHTDWTGLGSGFRNQSEFNFLMRGLRKLGLNMAVYYEQMIELVQSTGLSTSPFKFDTAVSEIGLLAAKTLKGRNTLHYFLGNDDFYSFDGSTPTGIAAQVREFLFENLNNELYNQMFSELLFDTQEYVNFLCLTASDTVPQDVWVFNYARGIWFPWRVEGMQASTIAKFNLGVTWDELPFPWDSQNYSWDSKQLANSTPVWITGHTNGHVYKWGNQFLSDGGTSIPCRWTSSDFTAEDLFKMPGKQLALKRIFVEYQGIGIPFTLDFYVSTDGGNSWTGPFSCMGNANTSGYETIHCDPNIVGNRLRFKFENDTTDESFKIINILGKFELHETETT